MDSRVNVHNLASTGVPFILTTVQVLNLALTHKKRITVQGTHIAGCFYHFSARLTGSGGSALR